MTLAQRQAVKTNLQQSQNTMQNTPTKAGDYAKQFNYTEASMPVAANDNTKKIEKRKPEETRDTRNLQERQNNTIANPNTLDTETKKTLGPAASQLLENPTKIRNKNLGNNNQENQKAAEDEDQEGQEELTQKNLELQNREDGELQNLMQQEQAELQRLKNLKNKKLEIIINDMSVGGVSLSKEEAQELMNSNFKVKFPWLMLGVILVEILANFSFPFVSLTLTTIGLAAQAVPVLGTAVGTSLGIVGFSLGIFLFFFNISCTIFFFFWRTHYQSNATDFSKKISLFKGMFTKYILRYILVLTFGILPIIGPLVNLLFLFFIVYSTRKLTRRAEGAVQRAESLK